MPLESRQVAPLFRFRSRHHRGGRSPLHEQRNAALTVLLVIALAWAVMSWTLAPGVLTGAGVMWSRIVSVLSAGVLSVYLFFAMGFERIR